MNASNSPQLISNAEDLGLELTRVPADMIALAEKTELGMACVGLLAKLENIFDRAKARPPVDYIDESAITARKLLQLLGDFAVNYLPETGTHQVEDEISRAQLASYAFDEVLKTRPLANALLRTFWRAEEVDSIRESHTQLGEAVIRAATTVLFNAVEILDVKSEFGSEIDQSAALLINEMRKSW